MIYKEGVFDAASSRLPRVVVRVGFAKARIKVLKRCSFSFKLAKLEFTQVSN